MTDPLRHVLSDTAFRTLTNWERSTNRRVEAAAQASMAAGGSGAALLPVRIHDRGRVIGAVLKHCPPDADGPAREPGAHDLALQLSPPRFAVDHLVDRVYDPIVLENGGILMFQRIANGSLRDHVTLRARYAETAMGDGCREIVRSVLGDWNAPEARVPTTTTVVEPGVMLRTLLGYRLRPGHRMMRWLDGQPAISLAPTLFLALPRIEDPLVNPIAVVKGRNGVNQLRVPMTTGLAHGDLHVDNVIVPRAGETSVFRGFRLIDLTTFASDAPLIRDPFHLLLSIVDLHLPTLGRTARERLAHALVEDETSGDLPESLIRAIEGVQRGAADWYDANDRLDDWHIERLLALAACALMFVARDHGTDAEAAWWYFTLAARATTRYLTEATNLAPGHAERPRPPFARNAAEPAPPEGRDRQGDAVITKEPPAGCPQRLSLKQRESLVRALLAIPCIRNSARLPRIIEELPDPLPSAVAYDSNDSLRDRVINLVAALDKNGEMPPWSALLDAVRHYNGPGREVDELAGLMAAAGLAEG